MQISHRKFLKDAGRWLLLAGTALVGFRLATRKTPADVCTNKSGVCRDCPALRRCGHPTALSFREAAK